MAKRTYSEISKDVGEQAAASPEPRPAERNRDNGTNKSAQQNKPASNSVSPDGKSDSSSDDLLAVLRARVTRSQTAKKASNSPIPQQKKNVPKDLTTVPRAQTAQFMPSTKRAKVSSTVDNAVVDPSEPILAAVGPAKTSPKPNCPLPPQTSTRTKQTNSRIAELEKQVQVLKQRNANQRGMLSDHQDSFADARDQIQQRQDTIGGLKQEVKSVKGQKTKALKQKAEAEKKLKEAEVKMEKMQEALKEREAECAKWLEWAGKGCEETTSP